MEKSNNISLFAVSFRQGFISPNVPIATFKQGDKELNFLLDSGSDRNVVDQSHLKDIEHTMVEGSVSLTGVGGTTSTSLCNIQFSCDGKDYQAEFLIADMTESFGIIRQCHSIVLHGIIGSKFLRENNIVMDFNNLTAYSKE